MKSYSSQGECYFRREGGDGGVGLDVLAVGDAFCWDEVLSKTAVACGTFGYPHGERGKTRLDDTLPGQRRGELALLSYFRTL